jgi:hypothetical protein
MQNVSASDAALIGAEIAKIQSDTKLLGEAKIRTATTQLAKFLGPDLVVDTINDSRAILVVPLPGSPVGTLRAARQRAEGGTSLPTASSAPHGTGASRGQSGRSQPGS